MNNIQINIHIYHIIYAYVLMKEGLLMVMNITEKIIKDHLVSGEMTPGTEIGLKIDQTLTQDATGTLVMQELEAMELDRAKTEASAQYVDHNLIQEDNKNPDRSEERRVGKEGRWQ